MIFPDWASEEELKLANEYINLPEETRGDLEEYIYSHSSKELTEVRKQYAFEKEEALKKGIILN
mgnify:CR=1 FL=1